MKMTPGRAMRVLYTGIFAAMTIGGLALGIMALRDYFLARSSLGWPAVSGTVTRSSRLLEQRVPSLRSLPGYSENYRVEYEYRIGGRRYRAERVAFMARGFFDEPEALVRKYPPGMVISVWHHPDIPALAVLEPGGELRNLGPLLFIAACGLLGGAWFLSIPWRVRRWKHEVVPVKTDGTVPR